MAPGLPLADAVSLQAEALRPAETAAQPLLDQPRAVGAGEVESDRAKVEIQPRGFSRPDEGDLPGSFTEKLTGAVIDNRLTVRPEAPQQAAAAAQSEEESAAWPEPSSRSSLHAKGPVPVLSSRAGRHPIDGNRAAIGTTGAEQPPIIRVSIGRVEVRAILPAAPVEQPPPPSPRLSLEKYLQQQNEVKR